MKIFILLLLTICISSCKPAYYKDGISEDQSRQDQLDCNFEASKASGYDYIDKAMNQNDIKKACLEAKGYTRQRKK